MLCRELLSIKELEKLEEEEKAAQQQSSKLVLTTSSSVFITLIIYTDQLLTIYSPNILNSVPNQSALSQTSKDLASFIYSLNKNL